MAGIFISYRRSASKHLARLIFSELRNRGYDVFLDVNTIDSGAFDQIILNQIAARPHFLLVLSPGALERCINEGDWLRREIEEAFRLKRNIVPIYDEGFNVDTEKGYLPEPLRAELPRLNAPPYSHYYFDAFIDTIANRFLKQPVYDVPITPTPAAERVEVARRIEQATEAVELVRSKVYDILPAPFEWVKIPRGNVRLEQGGYVPKGGQTFDVPEFEIAKYPVTNAQYAKFIKSGGYTERRWWTSAGWAKHEKEKWTEPHYWRVLKFTLDDYPVVGVSWYETIAFCNWLSAASGELIKLPTEQRWQRAVQGNDDRVYPWGDEWKSNRCNTREAGIEHTTPVQQYEGRSTSPFGVVDLIGNVWEWCQTSYESGSEKSLDGTDNGVLHRRGNRVLRGGSWDNLQYGAGAAYRLRLKPHTRFDNVGFRLCRPPSAAGG